MKTSVSDTPTGPRKERCFALVILHWWHKLRYSGNTMNIFLSSITIGLITFNHLYSFIKTPGGDSYFLIKAC